MNCDVLFKVVWSRTNFLSVWFFDKYMQVTGIKTELITLI